jgi:hypothetical protein
LTLARAKKAAQDSAMVKDKSAQLLAILQDAFNRREEGWLWVATYRNDCQGGVLQEITGHYEDAVETANALADIVSGCGADSAFFALCRGEARPTGSDRELWRTLRRRLDAGTLTDMVVFNRRQIWSMRAEEDAAAN